MKQATLGNLSNHHAIFHVTEAGFIAPFAEVFGKAGGRVTLIGSNQNAVRSVQSAIKDIVVPEIKFVDLTDPIKVEHILYKIARPEDDMTYLFLSPTGPEKQGFLGRDFNDFHQQIDKGLSVSLYLMQAFEKWVLTFKKGWIVTVSPSSDLAAKQLSPAFSITSHALKILMQGAAGRELVENPAFLTLCPVVSGDPLKNIKSMTAAADAFLDFSVNGMPLPKDGIWSL